jgi:cation:H+ antiporter
METLSGAISVFLVSSACVIAAGIGLARFGDELAEKTGWGTLWVGTLLVGIATSLPELTVNISSVWLEDSPGLALGNVFGANMLNVFVLSIVAISFGASKFFSAQGRDTELLILVGVGMVGLAGLMALSGDFKLGPTSLGGLLLLAGYIAGMRLVYTAGRTHMHLQDVPQPTGSARSAWIGFGISVVVVIAAGRYLASSADRLAEITGIGASFVGVLLVSIVTTLPEGSVTVAATLRRSYGIVLGNVFGSCAFNVSIIFFADLFHTAGPLLGAMEAAHFVAAAAAFVLMGMSYVLLMSYKNGTMKWTRAFTPIIPVLYIGALYAVFELSHR